MTLIRLITGGTACWADACITFSRGRVGCVHSAGTWVAETVEAEEYLPSSCEWYKLDGQE